MQEGMSNQFGRDGAGRRASAQLFLQALPLDS
jgi:hypothetical protein